MSPDRIVIVTFLHATAIALTVLRLRYRKRTHRLWWDDFTVFLAVVLDCGYVITLWFPYTTSGLWNRIYADKSSQLNALQVLYYIQEQL